MQKAYINALYDLISKDSRVVSLISDSGTDYDEMMAQEFPRQCFNFGIAEQHKVAAAAGMESCGKIPFVYTSGAFLVYRSYEFLRDDICLQSRNVKLIGMGSGISWRTLGPTHHTTEDIALLRVLPNLTIFSPATPIEVAACVSTAYTVNGPTYIRIGMSGEKEFFSQASLKLADYSILTEGSDAILFTTGSILSEAMDAYELLLKENISICIVSVCKIKPLNESIILSLLQKFSHCFVVEEHSIFAGLGGIIAELIARNNVDINFSQFALQDCFAKVYGTQKEIHQYLKIDAETIATSIKKRLSSNQK